MLIECDDIIQGISFTVCPSTAASSCTNTLFVGFPVITIAHTRQKTMLVTRGLPFEIMQQNKLQFV
jgi:hypothetical protein